MTPDQIKKASSLITQRDGLIRDIDKCRNYNGDVMAYLGKPEMKSDCYTYGSTFRYMDYPFHVKLTPGVLIAELSNQLVNVEASLKELGVKF